MAGFVPDNTFVWYNTLTNNKKEIDLTKELGTLLSEEGWRTSLSDCIPD